MNSGTWLFWLVRVLRVNWVNWVMGVIGDGCGTDMANCILALYEFITACSIRFKRYPISILWCFKYAPESQKPLFWVDFSYFLVPPGGENVQKW